MKTCFILQHTLIRIVHTHTIELFLEITAAFYNSLLQFCCVEQPYNSTKLLYGLLPFFFVYISVF